MFRGLRNSATPFLTGRKVIMSNNTKKDKRAAALSRYPGQRILIGDSIVVRISKVEGKRVLVFVESPEEMKILRPPKAEDVADRECGKSTSSTPAMIEVKVKKS